MTLTEQILYIGEKKIDAFKATVRSIIHSKERFTNSSTKPGIKYFRRDLLKPIHNTHSNANSLKCNSQNITYGNTFLLFRSGNRSDLTIVH